MNFQIADAAPHDVPAIAKLVRALAVYEKLATEMTATEEDFARALFGPSPKARAVLAFVDDAPVGLALYFYTFSTFLGKPGIYLEDIFVEPEFRGAGIGSKLLRHVARVAFEAGCGRMEWSALTWNQPAIDFYHRLGAVTLDDWRIFRLNGSALQALVEREESL